jgi:hypothetical protein
MGIKRHTTETGIRHIFITQILMQRGNSSTISDSFSALCTDNGSFVTDETVINLSTLALDVYIDES